MAESLQLKHTKFNKGTYLIVEGHQQAECFYIITSGNVSIAKESMAVVKEQDVLGAGDFFGVISAMSSHGYIENVQALTEVSTLTVPRKQYGDVIHKHRSLATKIITQFSKQMRYLDEALAIRTLKQKSSEDVSHLIDVAEYYRKQKLYNNAYFVFQQYLKHCPEGEKTALAQDRLMEIGFLVEPEKLAYQSKGLNRIYPAKTMFFSEAEPGDELFIIKRGSVKISKIIDQKEVLLAVLKEGDIFGEMALLENKPRTASAVAQEECEVMAVSQENFQRIADNSPDLITRITTVLADRIWLIYKQLTSTLLTDPMGRMYDILSIQLQKNRIDPESKEDYICDFGPKELITMAGMNQAEGSESVNKVLAEGAIRINNDKIICRVGEVFKLGTFHWNAYRRQLKIAKNRG
jgi:CRP-like cAMP-binding protein